MLQKKKGGEEKKERSPYLSDLALFFFFFFLLLSRTCTIQSTLSKQTISKIQDPIDGEIVRALAQQTQRLNGQSLFDPSGRNRRASRPTERHRQKYVCQCNHPHPWHAESLLFLLLLSSSSSSSSSSLVLAFQILIQRPNRARRTRTSSYKVRWVKRSSCTSHETTGGGSGHRASELLSKEGQDKTGQQTLALIAIRNRPITYKMHASHILDPLGTGP